MVASLIFPYFVGLFLGIQIGEGFERTNNKYYQHTEKIIKLEKKIKEYECFFKNFTPFLTLSKYTEQLDIAVLIYYFYIYIK